MNLSWVSSLLSPEMISLSVGPDLGLALLYLGTWVPGICNWVSCCYPSVWPLAFDILLFCPCLDKLEHSGNSWPLAHCIFSLCLVLLPVVQSFYPRWETHPQRTDPSWSLLLSSFCEDLPQPLTPAFALSTLLFYHWSSSWEQAKAFCCHLITGAAFSAP